MVGSSYVKKYREENNKVSLRGKNVLVVGGTDGIGAAAALKFSQLGASVTIGGRNKQNGAAMVEKMMAASPCKDVAQFHYLPVDITVMADVKRFAREYTELNREGLHTLLVTAGGLNVGPRRTTVEGIEHNFALSYLGRFLVINRLLPLLLRSGDGGRVMSVLSAGSGRAIEDLDDLQMAKPGAYSKLRAVGYNAILNDFMMEELTQQHRNMSFFHLYPGAVGTNIMVNSKVPLGSFITLFAGWLTTSPEDYAEVVVHIATSPEYGPERSGIGLNQNGEDVRKHKFLQTPGAREKIWNTSAQLSGLNSD